MANILKEIGTFAKNDSTKLVASVVEYNDSRFVDLQEWFLDANSKEYRPTKRGVTLRSDIFESLFNALQESKDEVMQLLLCENNK